MLDVIATLVSDAMLKGFSTAVASRDTVHADVRAGHALIKQEFGDIDLDAGLALLHAQPNHRLYPLVAWFDGPRLVKMTDADEYREASVARNRAAAKAQRELTLDHIVAWLFAHARFERAQEKFPLSKPAEPARRSPRLKAAVALAPEDFDAEAQAAILELTDGDEVAGRGAIAALIARGADPSGHLAAILCKVDGGHRQHLGELAAAIARQTGGVRKRAATPPRLVSSPNNPAPAVAAMAPEPTTPSDGAGAIDGAAETAALETLSGWVDRAWSFIGSEFVARNGLWVFLKPIKNTMAAAAYPIAGRSPAFQAILCERLGPPA